MKRSFLAVPAAAALALPLTACATDSGSGSGVTVVAELYPYAWIAEQVGGDLVNVTTLVPAGTDAHTFEVSPKQVTEIGGADLVVLTGAVATAVDDAVSQAAPAHIVDAATIVDVLPASEDEHDDGDAEEEHAAYDPHTWLAVDQLPAVVDAVAEALAAIDPDHADEFTTNAGALDSRLADLDAAYRTGLASCERDTVVVTHPAFGYLTSAYGLQQVGISGFDEDTEPSPARIQEVADIASQTGATTIFMANTSSPKVADVLASDLDLDTQVLSTITGAADGEDYISLAQDNLTALQQGLGCS
ncbi:zinc ABC transporter substrate-binding protein [Actinotalea sp. M2MS4P-6]|uniref:metal ABC transporter solute-binding protein, Zn/Mn family n=1 Tax=Actinotalea sp. M2MS4P-6 TaxID=2983762 RepID=UPI0021E41F53|nr:metal ABC transporter substrate-binding protein [Actinotalea sp. M2MS4P-6]MCV2393911.1 zinc ABC transporter substrate-binding protein [Actinotalea sp. M2MS4P-6]